MGISTPQWMSMLPAGIFVSDDEKLTRWQQVGNATGY
jgi:hypothetical protein